MRVAVILTTFNRPSVTARCLRALAEQEGLGHHELSVWIADASTNDETLEAAAEFANVTVIGVPSDTYWAQGMRAAWQAAYQDGTRPDAVIWLNDDVILEPQALSRGLRLIERSGPVIAGGAFHDSALQTSYSGYRRGKWTRRLALRRLDPAPDEPVPCDALNGNLVFVNSSADALMGGFPRGFMHGMADLHFTLRASARGIPVLLAPGWAGTCENNPTTTGWAAPSLTYVERWRRLLGPKGLPPRSWIRFCLLNGGVRGPLTAIAPYARAALGREAGHA